MAKNKDEVKEGLEELGLIVAEDPEQEAWLNSEKQLKAQIESFEHSLDKLPGTIKVSREMLEFVKSKIKEE